jgi:subtilisin family serine protease
VAPDAQQQAGIHQIDRPLAGRYIVVLRGSDDPLAVGVATANLSRGRLRRVYNAALHGFAVDLPEAAARALAGDPRVLYVEQDGVLTLAASAQGVASWGLDRINQRTLPLDGDDRSSRDGTGVNVHVVDTGIRVSHAEFGGRAFIGGDYVDPNGNGNDCHGHGTHVAGTIGGATYGVARNVTLWGHRVLDCTGAGSTSALIAAVDAITQDSTRRPAVVNLSLAAPASLALDAAIRRSISSGVTYVVAAGNGDVDAARLSPARVAEAITVGATTGNDRRASFSNFGAVLDLFAPGQSITSAAIANDTALTTMSGTSMASAHVAGVAALHLGDHPNASPASVQSALIAAASDGVVTGLGAGSPNRLLYSEVSEEEASEVPQENNSETSDESAEVAADSEVTIAATTTPYVTLVSPNGGDNWGVGSKQQIKWKHNLGEKTQMRVAVSRDGGATYSVLASAVTNKSSSGTFNWIVTGPRTTSALIRVSWTGGKASDVSDRPFTIAAPFVRVTTPNGGETWTIGSTGKLEWTDNLGSADQVEIRLSTNGGGSYPTVLASTRADGRHSVAVQSAWLTSSARVRITWPKNSGVTDASNNNFRIAASATANQPPSVALSAPANGATFTAPANITVSATASDTDGTIARVDFYRGSTLIASDTTSPYSVTWSSAPAGSYTLTAVARDDDGATTRSTARTITVSNTTTTQKNVVFTASPDHNTLVNSYLLEIFRASDNTSTATPIASRDLGKPAIVNGVCSADVTTTIGALPSGTYQVTISAVGAGGKARSAPFSFTR